MSTQPPLTLSKHFDSHALTPHVTAQWHKRTLRNRMVCQECQWLAHETHGAAPPTLRKITQRRTLSTGQHIDMCTAHAVLWKEKDAQRQP